MYSCVSKGTISPLFFLNLYVFFLTIQWNFSDENENKYDSDGEAEVGKIPPISLSNNNIVSNTSNPVSTSANTTPTRTKNPVKKIDLGAAANYGKSASVVSSHFLFTWSLSCNIFPFFGRRYMNLNFSFYFEIIARYFFASILFYPYFVFQSCRFHSMRLDRADRFNFTGLWMVFFSPIPGWESSCSSTAKFGSALWYYLRCN